MKYYFKALIHPGMTLPSPEDQLQLTNVCSIVEFLRCFKHHSGKLGTQYAFKIKLVTRIIKYFLPYLRLGCTLSSELPTNTVKATVVGTT